MGAVWQGYFEEIATYGSAGYILCIVFSVFLSKIDGAPLISPTINYQLKKHQTFQDFRTGKNFLFNALNSSYTKLALLKQYPFAVIIAIFEISDVGFTSPTETDNLAEERQLLPLQITTRVSIIQRAISFFHRPHVSTASIFCQLRVT